MVRVLAAVTLGRTACLIARIGIRLTGRSGWLEAAATTFRLIYQGEGEGEIKVEAKARDDAPLLG